MSLQIQLKKSAVTQKQPFASDLAVGELALNYNADGPFLTCKDTAGNVRKLNHVWVSATAPTGPSAGDLWLDTSATTAVLKVYKDSSATWVNATSIPLATTSVYGTVQLATSADITNGTSGKVVDAAQLQSKVTTEISSALAASPTTIQSLSVTNNAVVGGNLTVNGTTTTVNSETLLVKDKNIEMGVVATPTDVTADGGGITLKGTTDKTINWVDSTDSWTSSEHVDLASGKSYRINGTEVLSATALGSAVQISSANIPNGTIVDADVNASAEIAVSKLQDGSARQLLQTDAAGTGVEWTSNVDVPGTLDVTGATTLDSTLTVPAGSEAAPTVRFTGDTNTGIYSPGADQLALSTNGTGRLFVRNDGTVVVAKAITSLFSVSDTDSNDRLQLAYMATPDGTSLGHRIAGTGVDLYYYTRLGQNGSHIFSTNNGGAAAERLRITSAGLVGIGTSSPAAILTTVPTAGFSPADVSDLSGVGLFLQSGAGLTVGNGNYGSALAWSRPSDSSRFKTAIAPAQEGSDQDVQGLAFFTANSTSALVSPEERVRISAAGNVGIGTTSPGANIDIASSSTSVLRLSNTDTTLNPNQKTASIEFWTNDADAPNKVFAEIYGEYQFINGYAHNLNYKGYQHIFSRVTDFSGATSESLRIDGSGRLLVGTSSSAGTGCALQVRSDIGRNVEFFRSADNAGGAKVLLTKSRGTAASPALVSNADTVGVLDYLGYDGVTYRSVATVEAQVDGTPGANDMPGRLVFSTTADGTSSPTEQLRITSDRYVRLASGTGGIQFNGDTAAANALDDYEEGTFTPTITQGVTSPTYGGSNAGAYRIIGKQLFFSLRVQLAGGTADANQLIVGGLPIVTLPGSIYLYPQVGKFQNGSSNTGVIARGQASTNTLTIFDASDRTTVTGTEATNTLDLQITGSYPIG